MLMLAQTALVRMGYRIAPQIVAVVTGAAVAPSAAQSVAVSQSVALAPLVALVLKVAPAVDSESG